MSGTSRALLGWVVLMALSVSQPPPILAEPSGWSVDLKYGRGSLDDAFGTRHVKTFDDRAAAVGVEFGYRFNKYLGLQVGYQDFGAFDGLGSPCPDGFDACIERLADESFGLCIEGRQCLEVLVPLEAEVSGWSLALAPSWPFTERWSAFGKVGVLEWESDLSARPPFAGIGRFDSTSSTDLLTGVGLRYRFAGNLGALVEYQRLDLDLGSTTLGVTWNF